MTHSSVLCADVHHVADGLHCWLVLCSVSNYIYVYGSCGSRPPRFGPKNSLQGLLSSAAAAFLSAQLQLYSLYIAIHIYIYVCIYTNTPPRWLIAQPRHHTLCATVIYIFNKIGTRLYVCSLPNWLFLLRLLSLSLQPHSCDDDDDDDNLLYMIRFWCSPLLTFNSLYGAAVFWCVWPSLILPFYYKFTFTTRLNLDLLHYLVKLQW